MYGTENPFITSLFSIAKVMQAESNNKKEMKFIFCITEAQLTFGEAKVKPRVITKKK
jgi:hypothetical protein